LQQELRCAHQRALTLLPDGDRGTQIKVQELLLSKHIVSKQNIFKFSLGQVMFFQRSQRLPYSAIYIDNLKQRMVGVQRLNSSTIAKRIGMQITQGSELEQLSGLLGSSYKIDNRDGTKRLWIGKKEWIQYDPSTENFRFCDMSSGAVTVPFHSTRPQAMVDWVRTYVATRKELDPTVRFGGNSAWGEIFSSAGKTMQILGLVAWAALGIIAMSWLLGKIQFF
jgi:hypothetical protein